MTKRIENRQQTTTSRCVDVVLKFGEASINQVIAVVGKHIDTSRALNVARSELQRRAKYGDCNKDNPIYTKDKLIELGKRLIVRKSLICAVKQGNIRRVRNGVYATPLPKLYVNETQAG